MRKPASAGAFVLLALLLAGGGHAQSVTNSSNKQNKIQSLTTAISDNRLTEIRGWFQQVENDPALNDVEREALLYDGVLALSALTTPDRGLAETLARLSRMEAVSMTTLREGRHTVLVPTFDVASAARVTQRHWRRLKAREEIVARLSLGRHPIPERTGDPDIDQDLARGVELATSTLPIAALYRLQPALLEAYPTRPELAAGIRELALRTGDSSLLVLLAQTAPSIEALKLLRLQPDALASQDMIRVLDAMRERDDLASAAILKMGTLLDHDPAIADTLIGLLEDKQHGGSAAAALARHGGGNDLVRLSGVVVGQPDSMAGNRALMALRLSEKPAARDQLERLANDPRLSADKQAEVSQWLRQ